MQALRVVGGLAQILRLFSLAFLLPVPFALGYDEHDAVVYGVSMPRAVLVFLACALGTYAAALVLGRIARRDATGMADREGYLAVALGGLVLPAAAMTPFLAMSAADGALSAYLQSVSDLSTTGFDFLPNDGHVTPSLLVWRVMLQWLGGITIVAVGIALLTNLSGTPGQARQAESASHAQRVRPRLAAAAKPVVAVYVTLTAAFTVLLSVLFFQAGLGPRDAFFSGVTHAMAGIATGGGILNHGGPDLLGHPLIEAAMVTLMILGATHVGVLLLLRRGRWGPAWADREWRFFLGMVAVMATLVVAALLLAGHPLRESLRGGIFMTASMASGTGAWNVDIAAWPVAALLPLLVTLLVGGSSGSPAGGVKAFRAMLAAKVIVRQLRLLVHPRGVIPIRLGERTVGDTAIATAAAFLFTYLLAWGAGTLALALLEPGLDAFASAGASAAALANAGLAFGPLGPGGSAADLSTGAQVVLGGLMWLGRLEIFAALLLFYPTSWRH